jgi:hypothetical protein
MRWFEDDSKPIISEKTAKMTYEESLSEIKRLEEKAFMKRAFNGKMIIPYIISESINAEALV